MQHRNPKGDRCRGAAAGLMVALLTAPGLAGPAGGDAAGGPQGGAGEPGSIWDGPWSPSVAGAEAQRFVDLWAPRVLDPAWFQAYVERAGVPPEVLAEGFHGLDNHTRAYLTSRLYDHLLGSVEPFRADMAALAPAERQRRADDIRTALHVLVFEKESVLAGLRGGAAEALPTLPPAAESGLEAEVARLRQPIPLEAPRVVLPAALQASDPVVLSSADLLAPHASGPLPPLSQVAPARAAVSLALQDAAPVTFEVPAPAAAGEPFAFEPIEVPSPDPMDSLESTLLALRTAVDASRYTVCSETRVLPLRCSPEVPLGTPVTVDANGDRAPDLLALFGPGANPDVPLGATLEYRLQRLNPAGALPAHVFIVFEVPLASKRVTLGFDGRPSSLATLSTARVTLRDPALSALTGELQVVLGIAHVAPASPAALTLSARDLRAEPLAGVPGLGPTFEADPVAASLLFAQVPDAYAFEARTRADGSQNAFRFLLDAPFRTRIDALVLVEKTVSRELRELRATLDPAPATLDLEFVNDGLGASRVRYQADAVLDRFLLSSKQVFSASRPGTFRLLNVEALGVPSAVDLEVRPPFVADYAASARLGQVAVRLDEVEDGTLQRRAEGLARSLPTRIHLEAAQEDELTALRYEADAPLPLLRLALQDVQRALAAELEVQDVPTRVDLVSEGRFLSLQTDRPAGPASGLLSQRGAPPVLLEGDFASAAEREDGAAAVAFRVTGLRGVLLDQRDRALLTAELRVDGGKPFTLHAERPGERATLSISNLPEAVRVEVSPEALTYEATDIIALLALHAEVADLVLDAELAGLPARFTLAFAQAPAVEVAYEASTPIPRLTVRVRRGPLDAFLNVLDIPTRMEATLDRATGAASFVADAPIGLIEARVSLNGGFAGTRPEDHLVVVQDGEALGADLRLSGLQEVAADPAAGAFRLALNPGGQPFVASAEVDRDLLATLEVSNLPRNLEVRVAPDRITYEASDVVQRIEAQAAVASTGLLAAAALDELPERVDLAIAAGDPATITYQASRRIPALSAFLRASAGGPILEAALGSIPPFVQVDVGGGAFRFDARERAADAPGSASLGSLLVRFSTDGAFLAGTPAEDHVVVQAREGVLRAELIYRGLRLAELEAAGDLLRGLLRNEAPRLFTAQLDAPQALATATIDAVPDEIAVEARLRRGLAGVEGVEADYRASAPIARILVHLDPRDGQFAALTLRGLPPAISVEADLTGELVRWNASAPIPSAELAARALVLGRAFDALVSIEDIPAQWELSFAGAHPSFRAVSAPLGSIAALLTNHGTVRTFPGNHASLVLNADTGDLDASLRVTDIELLEFEKTPDGFRSDLRVGGGKPFLLHADVQRGLSQAVATVTVDPLPLRLQFAQAGTTLSFEADRNFALAASAAVGLPQAIAAAPTPPVVRGLAVRDGRACPGGGGDVVLCGTALRATLFLEGFPTFLSADPANRVFTLRNFRPPAGGNFLVLDAELDDVLKTPVDLLAVQSGMPTPLDLTVGPLLVEKLADGSRRSTLQYTASAPLGSFAADATLGDVAARLEVSNIPSSLLAVVTLGKPTSTVSVTTAQSVQRIFAGAKASRTDLTFAGGVELLQIPTGLSLTFGRVSSVAGSDRFEAPGVVYRANADTLDINAFVDAVLLGGDLKARVRLGVTNLARTTSLVLSGNTLQVASAPVPTENLEIHVAVELTIFRAFAGCSPSSCSSLRIEFSGHAGLLPVVIEDFVLRVTRFTSVTARLGLTSSLQGQYGTFTFGWTRSSAVVDVELKARLVADLGFARVTATIVDFVMHETRPFDVVFHIAANHMSGGGSFFHLNTGIPCDVDFFDIDLLHVHVDVDPHPHAKVLNRFELPPPGAAEGDAFLITPNPFGLFPDKLVEAAAAFTSPLGGGFAFDTKCH